MIKLRKVLLVSLFSLSLVGCSPEKVSPDNPNTSDSGNIDSNKKDNQEGDNKGNEGNDPTPTPTPDPTPTPTPDPEPEVDDPYKSGWSNEVVDSMLRYLGNQYIPYLNLGNQNVVAAEYMTFQTKGNDPYLKIDGFKEYDYQFVAEASETYVQKGYIVTSTGSGFKAVKDTLTVELCEDQGYIYLKVFYKEPYASDSATSWPKEFDSMFTDGMDGHTLPYFYLGTKNPYYFTENTGVYTVYGYGFKNEMVEKASATLSSLDQGWEVKVEEDVDGEKSLSASITLKDDCSISLTLQNEGLASPRAVLSITYKEGFDPDKYTAWDSETLLEFDTYLDSHKDLPVIYLGSKTPTSSYSLSSGCLTLTGGDWNEKALTNAKAKLEADIDSTTNASNWSSIELANDSLTAKRNDYSDGCSLSLVLSKDKNGKCSLNIYFVSRAIYPTGVTNWSSNVLDEMNRNLSTDSALKILDGHDIPYIYLNSSSQTFTTRTRPVKELDIRGGYYNPNLIDNAIDVYTKAGWKTDRIVGDYGYDGFKASKSFSHTKTADSDETDTPCEITVQIDAPNTSNPFGGTMELKAFLKEGYGNDVPSDWSGEIKETLKGYFNNYKLPVIYLGTSYIDSYVNDWMGTASFYGTYNDSIFEDATTVLTKDDWTITEPDMTSSNPTLEASKKDGEYGTISLSLTKYSYPDYYPYDYVQMDLSYDWLFHKPEDGAWSDDTLDYMKTNYGMDLTTNKNVIPYIYLHIQNGKEYSMFNNAYNSMYIEGGDWSDEILTLAKADFEEAGWDISYGYGSDSKKLFAVKQNADGSIYKAEVYSESGLAAMTVDYSKAATLDSTTTDWSDDTKTKMKAVLNNYTLPYFDLGKSTQVVSKKTEGGYGSGKYSYFTIQTNKSKSGETTDWTNAYIYNAEKVLKSAGWTTKMDLSFSYYGPRLKASIEKDDGVLNLALCPNSSTYYYSLIAWFDAKVTQPDDYSYSDTIKSDIKDITGIDMPSIYLGRETPVVKGYYSDRKYSLWGDNGSVGLVENAEKLFKADTNNTWKLMTYQDNFKLDSTGDVLLASTTNSQGETVNVYVYETMSLTQTSIRYYPTIDVRVCK